ncbi:hypothetical protein ACWDWT_12325 [Streptomyces sp. NPDC003343]
MTSSNTSLPAFNLTLTHTRLDAPARLSARQHRRQVHIERDVVRILWLVLAAVPGASEAEKVTAHFGWPRWNAPSLPVPTHDWKAIFNASDRSYAGLYRAGSEDGQSIAIRPARRLRVARDMWEILQAENSVVLSTGLCGEPTAAELGSAASHKMLHAVLAEAVIE